MKEKTSKTFGKIEITNEDIYKDLNWNGVYKSIKKEEIKINDLHRR